MRVNVADSDASRSPPVSLAPLIAPLSCLSNGEKDSARRLAIVPSTDTKQIKNWPFHY